MVCQWGKNYLTRISSGEFFLISKEELEKVKLTYTVPSMHIRGHVPSCSDVFGFKYMPNSGRNHGEGVETMWGAFNWLQELCRASGYGSRQDLLNDQFLFWNLQKIVLMGESPVPWSVTVTLTLCASCSFIAAARINREYAEAAAAVDRGSEELRYLEEALGEERVEEFRKEAQKKGGDQFRPSPEKLACKSISSQVSVCAQRLADPTRSNALSSLLEEEEGQIHDAGIEAPPRDRIHPAATISNALDLEGRQ